MSAPQAGAPRIRPKAVCVVRRGPDVLVVRAVDSVERETFYVPPGGAIEFGERAADAARREMREELGAEVDELAPLGVLENVFTYEGRPGHEIVFVFAARFADPALAARDEIEGDEEGTPFVARWEPLARFAPGGPPLYPAGLYGLLADAPGGGPPARD